MCTYACMEYIICIQCFLADCRISCSLNYKTQDSICVCSHRGYFRLAEILSYEILIKHGCGDEEINPVKEKMGWGVSGHRLLGL